MPPSRAVGSSRFFYGWVIVGVTFVTQFVATGWIFYGLPVVLTSLAEEFTDGQRTPVSTLFPIMSLTGMVMGPFLGRLIGRGYIRSIMTLAALAAGASLLLASYAQSLWQIQLVFATLVAFGMGGLTALTGTVLIADWFDAKRAWALGISQLGASLGGAIMAPVNTLLLEQLGWRGAFQVLGASALCIAPVIWLLVVRRPEDRGLERDGVLPDAGGTPVGEPPAQAPAAPPVTPELDTSEILRDTNLWLIALATGLGFLATGSLIQHIAAFGTDAGFTPSRAALLASILSAGAAAGKLVFGWLCDRIGEVHAFVTSCVGHALGLSLLTQLEGYAAVAICASLIGLSLGGLLPVSMSLMARSFGREQTGPKLGFAMPITTAVQLPGPIAMAWVFDATGSYDAGLVSLSGVLLVAALLVRRVKLPDGAPAATGAADAQASTA